MPFLCRFAFFSLLFGISYGMSAPKIKLSDGNEMPTVGLGTVLMTPGRLESALLVALEIGYRHIDSAFLYGNEKEIGSTLKKWFAKGGKREDLYITTKLQPFANRPSDVVKALNTSLEKLDLDYVDLYLIHHPFGFYSTSEIGPLGTWPVDYTTDHGAIWKELETQVKVGKVKSLGISNFNESQVLRLWEKATIKPVNLQVELNAYLQQEKLVTLCQNLGIVVTAYSPLGSNSYTNISKKQEKVILPSLLQHPVVLKVSEKHGKTAAQILLRYNHQRGITVIPKSENPKRIQENIDIFDFALTKDDMDQLKNLDVHGAYRKFDFLDMKVENHPEYPFTYRIPKY